MGKLCGSYRANLFAAGTNRRRLFSFVFCCVVAPPAEVGDSRKVAQEAASGKPTILLSHQTLLTGSDAASSYEAGADE